MAADNAKNSKKVLSPAKDKSASATPKKQSGSDPKIDDAYERKPSPINLKPLSPRAMKNVPGASGESREDGKNYVEMKKERTFSPRQYKISSR